MGEMRWDGGDGGGDGLHIHDVGFFLAVRLAS